MIYYKIIPDKRLIIEYFDGTLTLDEMLRFVDSIRNDEHYDTTFNSLIDLSEVEMAVSTKEVQRYVTFLQKNSSLLENRKLAIITTTPNHVVTGTLYQLLGKDLPLNIRLYSTFGAAVRWLGLFDFAFKDYTNIVKKIKE